MEGLVRIQLHNLGNRDCSLNKTETEHMFLAFTITFLPLVKFISMAGVSDTIYTLLDFILA
jgi:hypothetical protein